MSMTADVQTEQISQHLKAQQHCVPTKEFWELKVLYIHTYIHTYLLHSMDP
jgi:hypothetical protein